MIPRPLTDGAARYNPGRWICNKRPEKCNGIFRVYNQDMLCPLRAKCYWGRGNTYEWTPGEKVQGRYPRLDASNWRREHGERLVWVQRVFAPERSAAIAAKYRMAHKEQLAAKQKERYCKANPPKPPKAPSRQPLPCGEDCEGGCPYDTCPYTDADLDAMEAEAKRERLRQQSRDKYRRQKAREAVDPEYAADRKAKEAIRRKRYYEAHKDVLRAKTRERNKIYRRKQHNGEI